MSRKKSTPRARRKAQERKARRAGREAETTAERSKVARTALWRAEREGHVGVLRRAATFDDGRPSARRDRRDTKAALRRGGDL